MPTFGAAGRTEDVVHAAIFVDVRPFHAGPLARVVGIVYASAPDFPGLRLHRPGVGLQFGDVEAALPVNDVDPAVVVEEEARVVEIFREDGARPGTFGLLGFAYGEVSFLGAPSVGCAKGYVELAPVIADGVGPRPVEIELSALHVVARVFVVALNGVAGHFPVNQVG